VAHYKTSAVCSPLTLASEIGQSFLDKGGNAVDAAIATNLVLAVAYPHMCGVGGDVLAMVWSDGEPLGLNSSGALPQNARLPEDAVPVRGPGSATVPGAVAGWQALAERFGSIPLNELCEPAIRLAREGVDKAPSLERFVRQHDVDPFLDDEAKGIFLTPGPLVQADLAVTLSELDDFYSGRVAENAPEPFSADDFKAHSAEWVEPVSEDFAGARVYEMPPNSRGHLALQAIRRLEPLDGLGPDEPEWHARLLRALGSVLDDGGTVYLCAVDKDGMAISLNQSVYQDFGSGAMIPGTGVLLHNRGSYHSASSYGPGAKPIHTLSPAMALQDGRPLLVFGTMGGDAQIQIHLQLLARILVAGQDVEEAIAAPRWTYVRGELTAEDGLPDLSKVLPGVPVRVPLMPEESGHAHCIEISDGGLNAAADPRSDGVPVGR
jgi:gamma-glutamyltranspeptidase/glutathione hydrolase